MPRDHFYCFCNLKYLINTHTATRARLWLRGDFNCFLICLLSKKKECSSHESRLQTFHRQIFEDLLGRFLFVIFRVWYLWMKTKSTHSRAETKKMIQNQTVRSHHLSCFNAIPALTSSEVTGLQQVHSDCCGFMNESRTMRQLINRAFVNEIVCLCNFDRWNNFSPIVLAKAEDDRARIECLLNFPLAMFYAPFPLRLPLSIQVAFVAPFRSEEWKAEKVMNEKRTERENTLN